MGQIINRLFRIFKSHSIPEHVSYDFDAREEDELKRIIEELNNSGSQKNTQSNYRYTGNQQRSDSQRTSNFKTKEEHALENAFMILGLNKNCSNEDIKRAYKQKMKEFHPDKYAMKPPAELEKAKIKAQEINNAYSLLKKLRAMS